MKIQAKLAVLISLAVAVSVAATGVAFVSLQRRSLLRAESEKEALLFDAVRKVAGESLLAHDPLMLVSYLTTLRRERPEVRSCRVKLEGEWQRVGAVSDEENSTKHLISAQWPGPPARSVDVEIFVSRTLLAERERREFNEMLLNILKVGGATIIIGFLCSFPLSATLSRRMVRIEATLDEIGQGRFAILEDTRGSDEIARLARNVNVMSERLRELENMKKLLVASVSHELRSPLAAIESTLRGLLDRPSDVGDDARSGLQSIRKSAVRLEHFVSSMLEMAKIERGKLEFLPRESSLGAVVADAILFFESRARESGLSLRSQIKPGLNPFVFDPDLISQVLSNLISNAIKFTPRGGQIVVHAHARGDHAAVRVTDTGVGIPAEALSRIFTPFERVPNELRATGTGLGLAISKAIIERHGGRLSVESSVGAGSAFSFELPLNGPHA